MELLASEGDNIGRVREAAMKIAHHQTKCLCSKWHDIICEVNDTHFIRLLTSQRCPDCGCGWSFSKQPFHGKSIDVGGAIVITDERPYEPTV